MVSVLLNEIAQKMKFSIRKTSFFCAMLLRKQKPCHGDLFPTFL